MNGAANRKRIACGSSELTCPACGGSTPCEDQMEPGWLDYAAADKQSSGEEFSAWLQLRTEDIREGAGCTDKWWECFEDELADVSGRWSTELARFATRQVITAHGFYLASQVSNGWSAL